MNPRASIPCPGCGARLVLRHGYQAAQVTCPRCLAAVANPNAVQTRGQPCPRCSRTNNLLAKDCVFCGGAMDGSRPRGDVCPMCAEDESVHAANCPLKPLPSPRPDQADGPRLPDAATEAYGDQQAAGAVQILLASLAGFGMILFFGPSPALLFLCSLAFLSSVGVGGSGSGTGNPDEGCLASLARLLFFLFGLGCVIFFLGAIALFIMCAPRR